MAVTSQGPISNVVKVKICTAHSSQLLFLKVTCLQNKISFPLTQTAVGLFRTVQGSWK